MKQVLIIPGNTDLNRGDQALVWETIALIEDIYGNDQVTCVIMSNVDGKDAYMQNRQTAALGHRLIPTIIKHPRRYHAARLEDSKGYSRLTLFRWGFQAVKDFLHTRLLLSASSLLRRVGELLLSRKERNSLSVIKECDAVFVKGGGFIHSYGAITDPYFVYYETYHIRLAEAYGKKVFLLPNSIGPLKNSIARRITIKALKRCALITVREKISMNLLDSFGLDPHLFPDLGFFLKPTTEDMRDYLIGKGVPIHQKKVVITMRPYRFDGYKNAETLFSNYIRGFVCLTENLIQKGYHVSFVAHTLGPSSHEDDRIAIKAVLDALPAGSHKDISYIEDYELDCKGVEKIYSYYDYMVGTRFHSVIFALNVGVPAIAIAYGGNKSRGIMSVIGNEEYCIDMDKVNEADLVEVFDSLEFNRESYLAKLEASRIIINEQRFRMIEMVRNRQDQC